ncbi:MAG: PAAR domain-containing protein [Pseudomonadota bacterium]
MSYFDRLSLAVDQKASGVTGDQTGGWERAGNTLTETGGVFTRWYEGTSKSLDHPLLENQAFSDLTTGQQVAVSLRVATNVTGAAMGALSVVSDAINVGFANLTAPLAAVWPSFPASTTTSLYVGSPHGHSHPPSYIPAPPPGAVVPLPSIGNVLVGNHIKTLIGSLPAARCGDIGFTPTCIALTQFFEIKTGSSNVFIGGKRAARMLDIAAACNPPDPMNGIDKFMAVAGMVAGGVAVAADTAEAATEPDPAMISAKALSASMNAAQLASDNVALAIQQTLGKDPAVIPGPTLAGAGPMKVFGAITLGNPLVMIGGFPTINIPDPVGYVLNKLGKMRAKNKNTDKEDASAGTNNCP